MSLFEDRIQKLSESEDEFMLELSKLYHAADPNTTAANLDLVTVKRKLLVRIPPSLKRAMGRGYFERRRDSRWQLKISTSGLGK